MKTVFVIGLLFSSLAFGNTSTSSVAYPTLSTDKFIRKGNIELGGSMSYFKNDSSSSFYVAPDLGYFAADNFVLGLGVAYNNYESTSSTGTIRGSATSIGPRAAYFFYENGPFAAVVGQRIVYSTSSANSTYWSAMTSIGGKYFLNSSIAFGFDLNFDYGLTGSFRNSTATSVVGGFSTYF